MRLLSDMDLRNLFNGGRFQKEPTVIFGTLEYNEGCPVEFTVLDRKHREIGACWQGDIEQVVAEAGEGGHDPHRLNPNLRVFEVALKQITDFKAKVAVSLEAERRFTEEKIVNFPSAGPS